MSRYQGKALHRSPAEPRRHSPFRRPLRVLVAMLVLGALAMVPWGDLRAKLLVLDRIHVTGTRYLDANRVRDRSAL